jgi:riboflavin synthase
MFNGIIKSTGKINRIYKKNKNCIIEIKSKMRFTNKELGESISCSGACLSIDKFNKKNVIFYISKETLDKTNFKYAKKGDLINLEKSLKFGDNVSGHFVHGHVDTTCEVAKINIVGKSWYINFKLSKKYIKYIVNKGSITINGVSLTVSKTLNNSFEVVVIPQTLKLTNLFFLKKKDLVNVEFDILAKYIKKVLK